jgi:hypothetical protein
VRVGGGGGVVGVGGGGGVASAPAPPGAILYIARVSASPHYTSRCLRFAQNFLKVDPVPTGSDNWCGERSLTWIHF